MKKSLFGIRPSIYISAGMAAVIGVWLLSGQLQDAESSTNTAAGDGQTTEAVASLPADGETVAAEEQMATVRTIVSHAQLHQASLAVNGQTDFDRKVIIRSETTGRITAIDMEESHPVKKGTVIARISVDDRQARLDEAKALLAQREIQYSAAKKLAKRGFQSEIKRAEAAANLSAAKANLRKAQIDLNNTAIRAAFDGHIQIQSVEVGDYVEPNGEIATVVDLDPIYVKSQVSEREIGAIELGALAQITMITGEQVEGIVSRIAPVANAETRTFEVAVEVPNPDGRIAAGITASLRLPSRQIQSHLVSPALLTLNDQGEVGLKIVDETDIVRFVRVSIIEDAQNGMWVAGLPAMARIISVGQEYVTNGQHVNAVEDSRIN